MAVGITNGNAGSKDIKHLYVVGANQTFTVDKTKFAGLTAQKVASDTASHLVMDPTMIALVSFNGNGLTTGKTVKCGTSGTNATTILTVQNATDSAITFVSAMLITYCLIE